MTWLWPEALLLLGIIPLLIGLYIWMLRRRRRFAVRYSSLALVRGSVPAQSRWRRHLPFALFVLALTVLVIAMGRPAALVEVPLSQTTIVMALDVSRSMCSTDIEPNRLEAAKKAALAFIQHQKYSTRIGVVAFASFAEEVQPPTTDQEILQDAVESLLVGRRTAIGSAILKALDAIAEVDKNVAPSTGGPNSPLAPTPVPKGDYAPDIIVLLTDGVSNSGPTPLEAAQQAADRGVRVYTIGFGTAQGGEFPYCGPSTSAYDPFGGGGFPRDPQFGFGFGGGGGGGGLGGFRRGIDEATLKQVSAMTGGQYYPAESAADLQKVFQSLPTYLIVKHEVMEISVAFAALGALLALLAIGLSFVWHPLF
jgi:Ca-activated chloride channel family protein